MLGQKSLAAAQQVSQRPHSPPLKPLRPCNAWQPFGASRKLHHCGWRVSAEAERHGWQPSSAPATVQQRADRGALLPVQRSSSSAQSPVAQCSTAQSATAQAAQVVRQAGVTLAAAALAVLLTAAPAPAADTAKVGTCLLASCQKELIGCLADANCAKNLVCLQGCNGRPDETDCQIKCGDRYEDGAVQAFNACAVSAKQCVPQRVDEGVWPVPPDCALDAKFDLNSFQGRWYITAGLNPLFDTFPCQEHYFGVPEPGKLYGKIQWRIVKDNGDFLERNTVQTFKQQVRDATLANPAVLWNHDNEYLHYSDDWYILASKPDEYLLIYYKGNNDAWKGYGGATVYTREASLPDKYIPELREACQRAGLNWDKFELTDNTCPPHPPRKNPIQELGDDIVLGERFVKRELLDGERFAEREAREVEFDLETGLRSFGRGFTILEGDVQKELTREEQELQKDVTQELEAARKFLERIEGQASQGWLSWLPFKLPFLSK